MKKLIIAGFLLIYVANLSGQSEKNKVNQIDANTIDQFFDEALEHQESYHLLRILCKSIGPRLSGSQSSLDALAWSERILKSSGADTVYRQPCMVPKWERGLPEEVYVYSNYHRTKLTALANGRSIATGAEGIKAAVIEFDGIESLKEVDPSVVKGKIVFLNGIFDQRNISTGSSYGIHVRQRAYGPSEAAKKGALACLNRSASSAYNNIPHTGTLVYEEGVDQIPGLSIGVVSANRLHDLLKIDPNAEVYIKVNSKTYDDVPSYNVVGEIKGTEFPEEIITFGGHIDAWDVAEGAHDDGAGCLHAIGVIRLFKKLGIKPKRTLRSVMFINEENGLRGGKKYAEMAVKNQEKHIAAIESDAGGFSPRGFGVSASDEIIEKMRSWLSLFDPNTIAYFSKGGGGADINPLHEQLNTPVIGLRTDSQRAFDLHHSPDDIFENVHPRELELGTASMAALVYLIDKYGL